MTTADSAGNTVPSSKSPWTSLCAQCCAKQLSYMRQYPSILLVSILIFAALAATGITFCSSNQQSREDSIEDRVMEIAGAVGAGLSRQMEMAILPIFSMAQFATELDDFKDLPGEMDSRPFLVNEDGTLDKHRNVTGICDKPELLERYAEIASTIKKNLRMEGILQNIQLVPSGVICFSYGDMNLTSVIGLDILHDFVFKKSATASLKQEELVFVGPVLFPQCPTEDCPKYLVARLPIVSDKYQMEVEGKMYDRWGVTSASFDWTEVLARSQLRERLGEEGFEFELSRFDETFYNVETERFEEKVLLAISDGFGSKTEEVGLLIQAVNEDWELKVQYDPAPNKIIFFAVSILGPFCIAALVYTVLIQKQIHTAMLGDALAQQSKVDVERNMTAYFAHELRNPLGAIDSALSAMPDDLPPDAQELVSGMRLCSTFMSSIMNNLLDVRKIEEGKMVLRSDPLSLESIVQDVRKMTFPAVRSGVELRVRIETKGKDCVLGDIHRIQQVLNNLVTNAIKYTASGSITLIAGWEGDMVRLECQDTGPGIPKDEQVQLFERFVMRGGAPGTGLGLAIAKQIVGLMHGKIYFESDPTVKPGTSCVVLLPLPVCEDATSNSSTELQQDEAPIEEAFTILLTDDIKMNRNMLKKRIIKSIAPNCIISEASTGEEALSVCNLERYDMIIMDQYMEEAGGVLVGTDVIATMRQSKVDSFIIGCSGNDLTDAFLAAGASIVWGKPLPSNAEIIRQFRTALEHRRSTSLDYHHG